MAGEIFSYGIWTLSWSTWALVPWPGIEPRSSALGALSLSPWTTREVHLLWIIWEGPWRSGSEPGGRAAQIQVQLGVGSTWRCHQLVLRLFPLWPQSPEQAALCILRTLTASGSHLPHPPLFLVAHMACSTALSVPPQALFPADLLLTDQQPPWRSRSAS